MTVIVTDRLVLRPPAPGDAEAFLAYSGSSRWVRERGEQPLWQRWNYFAGLLGHWQLRGWGRFMATERATGRIIGHLGPLFPEGWPEPEIAWHLWHDSDEGKGCAFEAARAAVTHAFDDLGWPTAVSYIAETNTRSRRLAERLGAVLDTTATGPTYAPDLRITVWRHPRPRGLA
jgi:RimJ/RimL family protein N-acetyltransferase